MYWNEHNMFGPDAPPGWVGLGRALNDIYKLVTSDPRRREEGTVLLIGIHAIRWRLPALPASGAAYIGTEPIVDVHEKHYSVLFRALQKINRADELPWALLDPDGPKDNVVPRAPVPRALWDAARPASVGQVRPHWQPSGKDDDETNHWLIGLVELVQQVGRVLATPGALRTAYRNKGGGKLVPMAPDDWGLDDYEPRISATAFDPEDPWNPNAPRRAWIFVHQGDLDAVLDRLESASHLHILNVATIAAGACARDEDDLVGGSQVNASDTESTTLVLPSTQGGISAPMLRRRGRPGKRDRILAVFMHRMQAGKVLQTAIAHEARELAELDKQSIDPATADSCETFIREIYNANYRLEAPTQPEEITQEAE